MARHVLVVVLLAVAVARPSMAQSTPEAAAVAMGEAVKANDWAAAARLMYPGALKQLRDLFQPLVAAPGGEEIGRQLFGVQSSAEFADMPDTVLFATFLRTTITREAGVAEMLRTSVITPLGHVAGGGDTVLVVSRMTTTVGGFAISQFEVMPFVLDEGRWWGLLKADFTNMATMLRSALGLTKS